MKLRAGEYRCPCEAKDPNSLVLNGSVRSETSVGAGLLLGSLLLLSGGLHRRRAWWDAVEACAAARLHEAAVETRAVPGQEAVVLGVNRRLRKRLSSRNFPLAPRRGVCPTSRGLPLGVF